MPVFVMTQHTQSQRVVMGLTLFVILKHLYVQVHMILLLLTDRLDSLLQTLYILGSVTIYEGVEGGILLSFALFVYPRELSGHDIVGPQTDMTGLQNLRQTGIALSHSQCQTSLPGAINDIVEQ